MIPDSIANEPSTETCQLRFQEPLSPDDRLLISLLAERYAGKDGTPFLTFSRNGVTTLIVPKAIQRILPYVSDTFATEAPTTVRISDDGGANGISN